MTERERQEFRDALFETPRSHINTQRGGHGSGYVAGILPSSDRALLVKLDETDRAAYSKSSQRSEPDRLIDELVGMTNDP